MTPTRERARWLDENRIGSALRREIARGAHRIPAELDLPTSEDIRVRARRIQQRAIAEIRKNEAFEELEKIYNDAGEELGERELRAIRAEKPKAPQFPIHIFMLALIKDLIDLFVGGVPSVLLVILVGPILFFWQWGKVGVFRKMLIRKALLRLIPMSIFGSIPVVAAVIPDATIFVLLGHYHETKLVKLAYIALDAWQRGELAAVAREGKRLRQFVREEYQNIMNARTV